jgi:hypothetical protein
MNRTEAVAGRTEGYKAQVDEIEFRKYGNNFCLHSLGGAVVDDARTSF